MALVVIYIKYQQMRMFTSHRPRPLSSFFAGKETRVFFYLAQPFLFLITSCMCILVQFHLLAGYWIRLN